MAAFRCVALAIFSDADVRPSNRGYYSDRLTGYGCTVNSKRIKAAHCGSPYERSIPMKSWKVMVRR